jgi:hypothetical protein
LGEGRRKRERVREKGEGRRGGGETRVREGKEKGREEGHTKERARDSV